LNRTPVGGSAISGRQPILDYLKRVEELDSKKP
jgi:hypothetical protein